MAQSTALIKAWLFLFVLFFSPLAFSSSASTQLSFHAFNADASVNTYTGALHITHTELTIPGKGGLDIVVNRSYQTDLEYYARYVWTIHPGRIDGYQLLSEQRRYFVIDSAGFIQDLYDAGDGQFITADGWHGVLDTAAGTFTLTGADGRAYVYVDHSDQYKLVWDLSRVTDVHGNWLQYDYDKLGGIYRPVRIHGLDGREVIFTYDEANCSYQIGGCLKSMEANGQTWRYGYGAYFEGHFLTSVERPDGTRWIFDYARLSSHNVLSRLGRPEGGYTDYTFQVRAPFAQTTCLQDNLVDPLAPQVTSRTRYMADGSAQGNWRVGLTRAMYAGAWQELAVQGEERLDVYHHYDTVEAGQLWQLGALHDHLVYTADGGTLLAQTTYEWTSQQMAATRYQQDWYVQKAVQGRLTCVNEPVIDAHTYARRLSHKTVQWGNKSYATDYSNYTPEGAPQTVVRHDGDGHTRATTLGYFANPSLHIHSLWQRIAVDGEESDTRDYNTLGDVLRASHFGVATDYTYTSEGDVATVTDANGHTTAYTGYYRGTASHVTLPDGSRLNKVVNATGTIASATDALGYTTRYSYDGLNRVTLTEYPRGAAETIVYNGSAGVGGSTLTRGDYQKVTRVDDFGRVQSVAERDTSTGETRQVNYQYDSYDREVFHSYPAVGDSSNGVYTTYDGLGRVVAERFPSDHWAVRTYRYPNAEKTELTDALGHVTVTHYAVFGDPAARRLIGIDNALGLPEQMTTTLTRDAFGHVLSVRQGGVTRTYTLDAHKFVKEESNPETGAVHYTYDAIGNVKSKQVGDTDPITYTYDERDWLRETRYPNETVTWDYDASGHVLRVSNESATLTYTYDGNGNRKSMLSSLSVPASEALIQMIVSPFTVEAPTVQTVTYTYDDLDHLSSLQYPSGTVIAYAPNALGHATRVGDILSAIQYAPIGQVTAFARGNGVDETITMDAHWPLPRRQASSINNLRYDYDVARNLISLEDTKDDSYAVSDITYDGLDRITGAKDHWGTAEFAYDGTNNITLLRHGSCATTYSYSHNQLQSTTGCRPFTYRYDARGNMTSKSSPTGEALTLTFDAASHLRAVSGPGVSWHYDYDGLGEPVRKDDGTTVTTTLYDAAGKRLLETTATDETEYYYLGDQVVAANQRKHASADPGQITYYHWDVFGNTVAATDSAGALLWRKAYQVFGLNVRGQVSEDGSPAFISKPYEQETGLSSLGARQYAPALGRFISMDPAAVDPGRPFTFNRYLYGNNNPYKYIDPTGRSVSGAMGRFFGHMRDSLGDFAAGFESGLVLGLGRDSAENHAHRLAFALGTGTGVTSYAFGAGEASTGWRLTIRLGSLTRRAWAARKAGEGVTTPNKYFGSKTKQEVKDALEKKYGSPRSSREHADTYYNEKTKRSYNVHEESGHNDGKSHVDIRRRGGYKERKYDLKETDQ